MPYKTKGNRLVNEVTLGDGYPLSSNLKPLKVGGKASPLEMSSPYPDNSVKGKVKVIGDLEVTGSIIKQPNYHFINGGYYSTSTSKIYLPLVGYILEQTTTSSRNEYIAHAVPYAGKLKKVVIRSEGVLGTTQVGFHRSNEGTEVPNSTAKSEVEVDMDVDDTAYEFDFESDTTNDCSFVVGDIIAISVDSSGAAYDTNFTVVLEYYIN